MLTTQLQTADIPRVIARFEEIIGAANWLDKAALVEREIAEAPIRGNHLKSEHQLVLQLAKCSQTLAEIRALSREQRVPDHHWDVSLYPAITFAAQSLDLIELARKRSSKRAGSLIRRIRARLTDPNQAKALQLELMTATHFAIGGHSISWPEINDGNERFDILVESLGPNGLEVECKLVTANKGRKIHRDQAIEFFKIAQEDLLKTISSLETGLCVVVTVSNRMPSTAEEHREIVRLLREAILTASGQVANDSIHTRLIAFDPSILGQLSDPPSAENRTAIERLSSTENREAMIMGNGRGGLLITILQSTQRDSVVHEIFQTIQNSAQDQLSKRRPGLFVVGLQGITEGQLRSIVNDDNDPSKPVSALGTATQAFLERSDLDHVIGVSFLSQPSEAETSFGHRHRGTSYYFPKRTSTFWDERYSEIFGGQQHHSA